MENKNFCKSKDDPGTLNDYYFEYAYIKWWIEIGKRNFTGYLDEIDKWR